MLDAGMVGTEMLYFLVGSRELDGGAMCHRVPQPEGLHWFQAGARGCAAALRRRRDRRRSDGSRPDSRAPGGGASRRSTSATTSAPTRSASSTRMASSRCRWSSTAATAWPGRWPDRCSSASAHPEAMYFVPDGEFPDHEPNPLLEENRRLIIDKVRSTAPTRNRLGRRRRPLLLHRRHRRVLRRRLLCALLARALAKTRARRSSTTRAPAAPSPTWSPPTAGARPRRRSATPSSRRGCARSTRRSAARSPATTTSATSGTPIRGRSRRC